MLEDRVCLHGINHLAEGHDDEYDISSLAVRNHPFVQGGSYRARLVASLLAIAQGKPPPGSTAPQDNMTFPNEIVGAALFLPEALSTERQQLDSHVDR